MSELCGKGLILHSTLETFNNVKEKGLSQVTITFFTSLPTMFHVSSKPNPNI